MDQNEIYGRLCQAHQDTKALQQRDPDQELIGEAAAVIDAAMEAATQFLSPDGPLAVHAKTIVSVERIESGAPLRAADALVVIGQLMEALRPRVVRRAPSIG